jgi:spore coat polysaccharide biosynthesis protein SpsF
MQKTVAIVQARMKSSRLPNKVLLDLGGEPMLVRVVERTKRARTIDQVVVATTTDPSDDAIEQFCLSRQYPVYRGSQFDVLDRFYQAARMVEADVVVRLTADCPVIDTALIDQTVDEFRRGGWDFTATRLPPPWKRTYPIGLDIEVCSFSGLARAWEEAALPFEREHVMPYFYDQEGRFRIYILQHDPDYGSFRWTVDTPEDLELLRHIYAHFKGRDDFIWQDVLALVQSYPELNSINAAVPAKKAMETDSRMESTAKTRKPKR